jgi:hypothetical protein
MGELVKSIVISVKKGKRLRYGLLLAPLVFCLSYLFVFIIPIQADNSQPESFLPVSLHSARDAEYGFESGGEPVFAISLNIIQEVLGDQRPRPIDLNARLATVTAILVAPIPSATMGPNSIGRTSTATATNKPVTYSHRAHNQHLPLLPHKYLNG